MASYKWVISPRIWVISIVTLLITLLISTHEPLLYLHGHEDNHVPTFWLLPYRTSLSDIFPLQP